MLIFTDLESMFPMNRFVFNVYRAAVPKPLRTVILKKNLRKKILDHFVLVPENEINQDQNEIIDYLKDNKVSIFPYPFQGKYKPANIEVLKDPVTGMKYVMQDGKKLFFKRRWNEKRIRKGYSELSKEQDPESPHRYISGDFYPEMNDVVADIGAAEGNFSLSVIERVRKIYLFEYDHEWAEALEATFAPWKEKVEIVPRYVADFDDEKHIRIDTFLKTRNDITFLKIDVDGFEQKVLDGCRKLFEKEIALKVALCTYHKQDDEKDFTGLLSGYGFTVTASKGYMINYYDKKLKAPWLRRGLLRAIR
jgi:predicted RNA methylase